MNLLYIFLTVQEFVHPCVCLSNVQDSIIDHLYNKYKISMYISIVFK